MTFAVRDTQIDGVDIHKDDFMGILEGKIVATNQDKLLATEKMLEQMITSDYSLLTILVGEDTSDTEVETLVQFLEGKYSDLEIEVHKGNQPLYAFIFSLE